MTTINLDGGLLRAVALAAADRDIRTYLNGVCVQVRAGRCTIVATDGTRMHVGQGPAVSGRDLDILVPHEVIKRAAMLGNQMDLNTSAYTLSGLTFEPLAGKYPDWRLVVPRIQTPCPLGCMNLAYLADLRAAAKLLGLNKRQDAVFHTGDDEGFGAKSLVKFPARPDFLAILLGGRPKQGDQDSPMWVEAMSSAPPAWMV